MPTITDLLESNTFRAWKDKTNEIIAQLNNYVISDGATAYGTFVVGAASNTSFNIANSAIINLSSVIVKSALTISANATVNSSANVVNLAPGSLLLQPVSGTTVNSALVVNGTASFLLPLTANANVTIAAGLTQITGNVLITGQTTANGALVTRQILYSAANAVCSPSALSNPQYDDFTPTGLAECEILNLTPSIDTVITGLAAPGIASGARILYIQNLSTTYKITLGAANTASAASNRFATPSSVSVEILPGATLTLIWNYDTSRWRVAAPLTTAFSSLAVTGNGSITGTLTVGGNLSVIGASATGNVTIAGFANVLSTLQVAGNTSVSNLAVSSGTVLSGNLTASANVSLGAGAVVVNTTGNTVTLANTLTTNSSSQSFVRNLKANTFTSDGSATLANVAVSGIFNAASGKVVLPVGTNLWA